MIKLEPINTLKLVTQHDLSINPKTFVPGDLVNQRDDWGHYLQSHFNCIGIIIGYVSAVVKIAGKNHDFVHVLWSEHVE